MGAARATIGELHRAEQLLLDALRGALVELLVGLAERRERKAELLRRLREHVQDLLTRIRSGVGHQLSLGVAGLLGGCYTPGNEHRDQLSS